MTRKAKSTRTVSVVVLVASILVGAAICVFSFTPMCRQLMHEIRGGPGRYSYYNDYY